MNLFFESKHFKLARFLMPLLSSVPRVIQQFLRNTTLIIRRSLRDNGDKLSITADRAFLRNAYIPAVILLEGSAAGGGGGGGEGALGPGVALARRAQCVNFLYFGTAEVCDWPVEYLLCCVEMVVGCIVGGSRLEGARLVGLLDPERDPPELRDPELRAIYDQSADLNLLYNFKTRQEGAKRALCVPSVADDPFWKSVWSRRRCETCGLLPGSITTVFQACSLCLDPSVGRFCCKEPCFAAFWRGGHKNTCAGRDKMKRRKEGGGGGGGGGGSSGGTK
jgi:hypothetical protein